MIDLLAQLATSAIAGTIAAMPIDALVQLLRLVAEVKP